MYEEGAERAGPCDVETFNRNPLRMFSVASNVVYSARRDYLECKSFPEDVAKVQAVRLDAGVTQMVEVGGHRYLDGGTTDSIPFEVALGADGARKVEGYDGAQRAGRGASTRTAAAT